MVIIDRRSKTTEIPYLDVGREIVSDLKQKVESLNDYFVSAGSALNGRFPANTQPIQTISEETTSIFKFTGINIKAVQNATSRLKFKCSFGVDGISSYFLKIAAPVISKGLAKIFNKSLSVGRFPEGWKISKVAPIFKAGVKSEMGNCRPISVLSTVARVFGRLVYDQLSYFMEQHKYLSQYQSGFRKFHSTITAMLKNSNDWLLNMDKGSYNGVVFFDIKKAFDAVDHDILLSKLRKYGVLGIEFEWFMSYLTDRKQSCTLSGENSSFKIDEFGIPQGSCLGPLLFLIYINDLRSVLRRATPSMFADDTSMWVASESVPKLLHPLRDEITLLERCGTISSLSIH